MKQHSESNQTKELFRYIIPSVGAMLFNALYVVVDGIFVGNGLGEAGLAAVNLAMPTLGLMYAIGIMMVMGGATISAVCLGRGDKEKANRVFLNDLLVTGILSVIFSAVCLAFAPQLAYLSGGRGELLGQTAIYIRSYIGFGVFFVMSYVFSAFVRNDGDPTLAFWGMASGALANIFLDWLFIYPLGLGIMGAGLASGLSTVLSFFILLTHFIRKKGDLRLKKPTYSPSLTKETIKRGFPEFVTQMFSPVMTYCYNIAAMEYYGDRGVAAYSVIGYLLYILIAVASGVAQGVQPLISRSYGAGEHKREQSYFRTGILFNIALTSLLYVATLIGGEYIYRIFNDDAGLIALACEGSVFIGAGTILTAANISLCGYFLATQRTKQALIVSACRSFVVTAPMVLLAPKLLGSGAVWSGMIGSELCIALLALVLFSRVRKKYK